MARNQVLAIDVGGMKSAVVREDGSLIIMARKSLSDFTESDWAVVVELSPEGVKALRDLLVRDAQLRIGADEAGQNGEGQAIYHECGNCGVPRFAHGVILEACPNCGDDETDLSLIDEVP